MLEKGRHANELIHFSEIWALAYAEKETGLPFEKFSRFSNDYKPLDLYDELQELFSPGYRGSNEFFSSLPPPRPK